MYVMDSALTMDPKKFPQVLYMKVDLEPSLIDIINMKGAVTS